MYTKGLYVDVVIHFKALLRFGASRSTGVESMSGLIYSFSHVAIPCCHFGVESSVRIVTAGHPYYYTSHVQMCPHKYVLF